MNDISMGDQDTTLVPANELKEMTVSRETIFNRQKESIMNSMMSAMVGMATENGEFSYTANLNPKFDPGLMDIVVKEFTDLGYNVEQTNQNSEQFGAFVSLTISWS